MKILVCIKQVPDPDSRFRPNAGGVWFDEADIAWRMNEYDEYAVEQALRLKEQLEGVPEVIALSVGPERVLDAVRKAMAMGCDAGVHIHDTEASTKEPRQIAGFIAACAKREEYDLIFTGVQSQDRGSAQTGVLVAELLGFPCVTAILDFAYDSGTITVRRELEGGLRGVVRLRSPALFTCQTGLNIPRYPTLPNILKANKKEIKTIPVSDLPTVEPLTISTGFYPPAGEGSAIVLEGELSSLADRVVEILLAKR
ncbi:MAG TPA: electron transfer flavoprotein subunit beta/FixA family protein [Geobacteraceae bacterium]